MFNKKRIHEMGLRLSEAEQQVASLQRTMLSVLDALEYGGGLRCSAEISRRTLHKSADIDRRIDRLMKHLGLREEFVQEHTIITKEKK